MLIDPSQNLFESTMDREDTILELKLNHSSVFCCFTSVVEDTRIRSIHNG